MSDLTRADLTAALDTQSAVIKRDLNDRFEHFEKRQDEQHREIIHGFAQVIENVNAHMDQRCDEIENRLEQLAEVAALRESVLNIEKRLARLETSR